MVSAVLALHTGQHDALDEVALHAAIEGRIGFMFVPSTPVRRGMRQKRIMPGRRYN